MKDGREMCSCRSSSKLLWGVLNPELDEPGEMVDDLIEEGCIARFREANNISKFLFIILARVNKEKKRGEGGEAHLVGSILAQLIEEELHSMLHTYIGREGVDIDFGVNILCKVVNGYWVKAAIDGSLNNTHTLQPSEGCEPPSSISRLVCGFSWSAGHIALGEMNFFFVHLYLYIPLSTNYITHTLENK